MSDAFAEFIRSRREIYVRRLRAVPALALLAASFGLLGTFKAVRALSLARSFGITASDAWNLLSMASKARLARNFAGHEVVFMDFTNSALVYVSLFALAIFVLVLYQANLSRQLRVLESLSESQAPGASVRIGTRDRG